MSDTLVYLKVLVAMATFLAVGCTPSFCLSIPGSIHRAQKVVTPAKPALPEASVGLTMPVQKGRIRKIPAGDSRSFQNALNAAKCGDTIVVQAGSTYSGNFTIPNIGSCSGWVVVESSQASSLPSGTRVSPSSVSDMAMLSGATATPVLRFTVPGIHNFRFIALEIDCGTGVCSAPNDLMSGLVEIDGGLPSTTAQTPDHMIVDRCYIHGTPTQNIRSGIRTNGTNIAVVDSYISEIHESGAAGGDSQAIEDWNGAGPILIQNNYLESASENVLFGGVGTEVPGLIPSDITIVGNYFYKDPSWRNEAAPYNWVIKNLLEFKNAQRVLVQGNVFDYSWLAGQRGAAILLTPRSEKRQSWHTVADFTFIYNLVEHVAVGFVIGDSDDFDVPTSQPPQRILIQNNVLTDINATWSPGGGGGFAFMILDMPGGANPNNRTNWHDLTIDHNDLIDSNADIYLTGGRGPLTVPAGPIQITNNVGSKGIIGAGKGYGNPGTYFYLTQLTWNKNVLPGATTKNYPGGTLFSSLRKIGFTAHSLTKSAGANYQLLSTSPFHNAGTDGKDIGVCDWSTWDTTTSHALSGIYR